MSVPSGMQMLFKQLGIDPEKIIQMFEGMKTDILNHLIHTNESLLRIERKQDFLAQHGVPLTLEAYQSYNRIDGKQRPILGPIPPLVTCSTVGHSKLFHMLDDYCLNPIQKLEDQNGR